MDTLREEVARRLDELSPEELQAVHQLIRTFKRRSGYVREEGGEEPVSSHAPAPDAVRRVREALADVPGSFSDVIAEEREK
ncbi:hypothetical protein GGQ02_003095 [Salinibacter ruber]|nr:hypothetical protein [Salinibacter ruber]